MARIISIVNQKGGTGKSACTANLAVGLAQKNMKVLIVDADPQSDVSAGFGYRDCDDSNETLTVLMDAVMKDEDIPSDCYIRHIRLLCSYFDFADFGALYWSVAPCGFPGGNTELSNQRCCCCSCCVCAYSIIGRIITSIESSKIRACIGS